MLAPAPGATVIDVGCGTGYFTRRFALDGQRVTGVDLDPSMLEVARARRAAGECYVEADARTLPFERGAFEYCVSVTALCFIAEESVALAEMFRVTRRRLALGLLNRRSVLYLQKGRRGGTGAYRGAHWHTAQEVRELFSRMSCEAPQLEFAVFLPSGRLLARAGRADPAEEPSLRRVRRRLRERRGSRKLDYPDGLAHAGRPLRSFLDDALYGFLQGGWPSASSRRSGPSLRRSAGAGGVSQAGDT